jgi:hypothetical protein
MELIALVRFAEEQNRAARQVLILLVVVIVYINVNVDVDGLSSPEELRIYVNI